MFPCGFLSFFCVCRSVTAWRSYLLVAGVAGITAFFRYYECATVPQTGRGVHTLFDFLFQKNDMQPIMSQLIMYFFYKFLATALSVTLPLPVGLFTPVFLTGGVFGRICGEIITRYPHFNNYFAWEYSVLGAAGLATGVTRAMSTAVIVYELAGQPHLRLPLSSKNIELFFILIYFHSESHIFVYYFHMFFFNCSCGDYCVFRWQPFLKNGVRGPH